MSKNACRMTGLILMLVSIFFLMAGLYLPYADIPSYITVICLVAGILLFMAGIVFYKILKAD